MVDESEKIKSLIDELTYLTNVLNDSLTNINIALKKIKAIKKRPQPM
jgi:hypothetical protein